MPKNCIRTATALMLVVAFCAFSSCKKGDNNSSNNNTNNNTPPPTNPAVIHYDSGWTVSTLAGKDESLGYVDGDSMQARFDQLRAITQDGDGNLYVVDFSGPTYIRMITPAGKVSTFFKDDNDIIGISRPSLVGALGLATDKKGTFFSVSLFNYYILKVTATKASLFAGYYQQGYRNGHDSTARFGHNLCITRDPAGNLFVPNLDSNSHLVIRKITPDGNVSTLALNDPSGNVSVPDSAKLSVGWTICADSSGNLYYTSDSITIKKADPLGNVTVLAGSTNGYKDGKGKDAQFKSIYAMDVDKAGNLWVSDDGNYALRKVSPDGTVTTIAGNGTKGFVNGSGTAARFDSIDGLVISQNGTVYVIDYNHPVVRKVVHK